MYEIIRTNFTIIVKLTNVFLFSYNIFIFLVDSAIIRIQVRLINVFIFL